MHRPRISPQTASDRSQADPRSTPDLLHINLISNLDLHSNVWPIPGQFWSIPFCLCPNFVDFEPAFVDPRPFFSSKFCGFSPTLAELGPNLGDSRPYWLMLVEFVPNSGSVGPPFNRNRIVRRLVSARLLPSLTRIRQDLGELGRFPPDVGRPACLPRICAALAREYQWSNVASCRLPTAHCWPPATQHLLLTAYSWPPTVGRLLLAAYCWLGRRLLAVNCCLSLAGRPPSAGRMLRIAYFRPPTPGQPPSAARLVLLVYCWPPNYRPPRRPTTIGRLPLAASHRPPAIDCLPLAPSYWPLCIGRLLLAACYEPPTACRLLPFAGRRFLSPTAGRRLLTGGCWPSTLGRLLLPTYSCPPCRLLWAAGHWSPPTDPLLLAAGHWPPTCRRALVA